MTVAVDAVHKLLRRFTADTIAVAPPFISSEEEIANMIESLRGVLRRIA